MRNGSLFVAGFIFALLCVAGVWWVRADWHRVPLATAEPTYPTMLVPDPSRISSLKEGALRGRPVVERPLVQGAGGMLRPVGMAEVRAPAGSVASPGALEQAGATAVRPGEEQPRGTVDKEAIRVAVAAVKPLVAQCFLDAKDRYPPPQKVVLRFTIQGQGISGHFVDGEVQESTIIDPWVQSCFLESLVDARFPPPEAGGVLTVSYPFNFTEEAPGPEVR